MSHICSHQHVWTFDNFLRPLFHNPDKIFGSHVQPGMRVMDVGCGAGFAALELAKRVGDTGRVVAVDVQLEMLAKVEKRARKLGLADRIQTHLCQKDSLQVEGVFDMVNAFYMVHEAPDTERFLRQIRDCLAPDGIFLVIEPRFHVSKKRFEVMLEIARQVGFATADYPKIRFSQAVVLTHRPVHAVDIESEARKAGKQSN
jgi:ubiquinone/menaquinone biosynthesis C-methylase UbiE